MTPVRPRRQAANVQRGGLIFRWRYMAAILGGSATIPMICRQQFLLPASAGHDGNAYIMELIMTDCARETALEEHGEDTTPLLWVDSHNRYEARRAHGAAEWPQAFQVEIDSRRARLVMESVPRPLQERSKFMWQGCCV